MTTSRRGPGGRGEAPQEAGGRGEAPQEAGGRRGQHNARSRGVITRSPDETEAAAARLARHVHRGDLVLLSGHMGSGKTTFVRGLARGMGTSGDVMSPTFQLVRIYAGPIFLAHVDLYRVAGARELADLGLDELLDQGAVVVEWGDRLPDADAVRVTLEVLDQYRRRLLIEEAPSSWSW
jgi:tRNA threonylcarbamoyladenosine biosynthesis protein TsaE